MGTNEPVHGRNVREWRADNCARAGRAVSPEAFPASPVYIMRGATLLNHSALSCCSKGESNSIAMLSPMLPLAWTKPVSRRALAPARNSKLAASANSGFQTTSLNDGILTLPRRSSEK